MHLQLGAAASALKDLLYPPRCVGCGRFGVFFCVPCQETCIPATGAGRCKRCSARWDGSDNCPRCFEMQSVESVFAAFEMDGPARCAVHRLKYSRVRDVAHEMAPHVARVCEPLSFDYAVAVPLHPSRQRYRGFNQAEELLRPLGFPALPGTLRRARKTEQQVGRSMRERRQNISGAFAYEGQPLDRATVLLVDDVVTTGATVETCARILAGYGARTIHVAAFARASYNPETAVAIED